MSCAMVQFMAQRLMELAFQADALHHPVLNRGKDVI
jgi:hypothetical protein